MGINNYNTILIFTYQTAINNPGPTRARAVIRKNGLTSPPIKLVKAVASSGTRYKGELEAITISTEYAKEIIPDCNENIHIFVNCQSAIHAIKQQNNENYHHLSISSIRKTYLT